MSPFAFLCCQPGLEGLAKRELARTRQEWRLAYSRPGLITFKTPARVALDAPAPTAFARVWGRALGSARDVDETRDRLRDGLGGDDGERPQRVHVFARDPERADGVAAVEARLADALAMPAGDACDGERVLDVIIAADGEPWWLGAHAHGSTRPASPGGLRAAVVPPESPSRAYAKIEEAIAWAHLPIAAGHRVLEIGSAPGGAALALVRRGVHVFGVDAAAMHPRVLAEHGPGGARVVHLPIKVGALRWEDLPTPIDWLLCDVNLAPQVALHELARLIPPLRASLRGAVITIKLNEDEFVDELETFRARIAGFGFSRVELAHLPANRRELCAIAVR